MRGASTKSREPPISTIIGMARWFPIRALNERDKVMPPKKISPQATPFLKTAAEAIGTALGKLAVKTGVAAPTASPSKRSKAKIAAKKKAKPTKKAPAKKTSR